MSNREVAEYLLKHGLEGMDGCVYLDENDKQRIILRGNTNSLNLRDVGISKARRFSFYDQVHTTGMYHG